MAGTPPKKLGPGTLIVGSAGSEIDMSCQVISCEITWEKAKDDDTTVLCGETVAGATTYSAQLTGSLFQDTSNADGIVRASWDPAKLMGKTVPFEFVPNTADAIAASGQVTVDPLSIGSDEAGANMDSDFTWDIVGHPTLGPVTP